MSVARDRFSSPRDTLAFVVCILLAIAARLAPPPLQDGIASAVRGTVLVPFLSLQRQAEEIKAARTRYATVVAQRDSVFLEALQAQTLKEENERLRETLALSRRVPIQHVAAAVLPQAGPQAGLTFVLSAGRNQGVQPADPVIATGGLVGVVRSVESNTATAIVWAHPDFRVSAMSENGEVFGIVAPGATEGPNAMLLELRGVPYRDLVPPGTRVLTSGLGGPSGVYPRGIPVGEVIAVVDEREGWSRTYLVRPAVHPAAVSHVIVLTGEATDLGATFGAPPP